MAVPVFHIAVDGAAGITFQSFPSSAIENGDPTKILLATIRNACRISTQREFGVHVRNCCIPLTNAEDFTSSNKLFFTIDGKSRIADSTTLAYYMSLTPEGRKILEPPSAAKQPKDKEGADKKENEDIAKGCVSILTLKVSDGKVASSPRDLPDANETLSKLLDNISESKINQGDLLTFTDRELASLKANYAVAAGSGGAPEPADMTEEQWDKVFTNNRALHGYFYDFEKNILVKAPFKLRGASPVGKPPVEGEYKDSNKDLPPFPPFYIADDAQVGVTEVRNQFHDTLTKQGFNSLAIGGSIGGGPTSIPVNVSASFEKEHAYMNQKRTAVDVNSLVVTYNFPRVVVELDQDSLELTDECRRDALRVCDRDSKERFFRDYGMLFVTPKLAGPRESCIKHGSIFASQFSFGGFLHSTRNVSSTERSNLDQVKDRTRIAAGISIQSPKASGSINFAKVDENSQDTGSASLLQDVRLTWDARGGDTLLCSNPPAWANTVKNYKLWRLMDQQRLVKMEGLIQDIDIIAYRQLENPDGDKPPIIDNVRDAVIHDANVNGRARINLVDVFMSSKSNALATRIQKLYEDGHYETETNIAPFNNLFEKNFPKESDSLIKAGSKWGQLTDDQKVAFGIYLASLGQVQVV
ncbi:hypothetical protein BTUL_0239g00060 [Botrytis tulipae]|uniref:MACPF domain-containing protein n=1 Tax=Botrytis tulipae TaxID=87230 RepID=A0A4Z1E789_9HELO|nr:hypothetical protein BTUL_0239g00060 [Botrytis tulipae]